MPIKRTESESKTLDLLTNLWQSGNRACRDSDRPHIARFLNQKFAKITTQQPIEQQLERISLALMAQVEKQTRQFVGPLKNDYRALVFAAWQQFPPASKGFDNLQSPED